MNSQAEMQQDGACRREIARLDTTLAVIRRKGPSKRALLLCGAAALTMVSAAARAEDVVDNGAVREYTAGSSVLPDTLVIGREGEGTVAIHGGATVVMNTVDGSTDSRIEIGNGGTGALRIDGGTLTVNIADGPTAGSSIGRIWVGGGQTNTTGGTGTLTMSSGLLEFTPVVAGTGNYGGLAIGRGAGVTGTVDQAGGTVRFQSGGAIDLGIFDGQGAYNLSGDAQLDAGHGGVTMYIGSRGGGGEMEIRDSAAFTMTTGANSGGQLYVGDAGGTGIIRQSGPGSTVTLGLMNPIRFGSNLSNAVAGGGTGTYELTGGTLNVLNVGGSNQIIFGDAAGGTGNFRISGGTANIASNLVLANAAGSTGLIEQTGGTLALNDGATLRFGAGVGTYNLQGGTLLVGGANGISGTGALNLGTATLRVQDSALTTAHAATLLSGTQFTLDTNGLGAQWGGALSGDGALIKAGGGTLTLTAANTYAGATTISGGTLALTGSGRIGANARLTNDGVFDLSGATSGGGRADIMLGSLSGSGEVISGTNLLIVGTDNTDSAFSGTIRNGGTGWDALYGRFAKGGTGTLTIDGAIISGGEAYVLGGTLAQTSGNTVVDYLAVGSGTTSGTPNSGRLLVSGGTISFGTALQVGDWGGSGLVEQSGGEVRLSSTCLTASCASLNIGNQGGTGRYAISGGALLISGASHSLGRNAGANPAGHGELEISGTALVEVRPTPDSRGFLVIGDRDASNPGVTNSTGVINQSGGTLRFVDESNLYLGGYGSGTYNLTGGALEIGGTSLEGRYGGGASAATGSYAFNLGGGTIRVIGSTLTTGVDATLVAGTSSTIDTAGFGATWSGVLSGGGHLIKAGASELTLTGANTYTGGTTIAAGTLRIGNGGSLLGDVATAGTLAFDRAAAISFGGVVSGTGGLAQRGAGSLALTAANTFTGETNIAAGSSLFLAGAGGIAASSRVATDGTLDISGTSGASLRSLAGGGSVTLGTQTLALTAAADTFSGAISGAGGLAVTGGTQILSGTNSYAGGTAISTGATLQLGNGGATGSIAGNVANGGTLAFYRADDVIFTGAISGTGAVEKAGAGRLTLTQDSSYSGGTIVAAGELSLLTSAAAGTGTITLGDGTTLAYANGIDVANALIIAGAVNLHVATGEATQSGNLSGSGTYALTGDGLLRLTGNNSGFSGDTVLSGVTVDLTSDTTLGSGSVQVVGDAGLQYAGGVTVANAIGVTTGSTVTATLGSGDTALQAGAISGGGALAVNGGGTLVLIGDNTHTGGTTITSGTLQIGNGGTAGSIVGNVVNEGTLAFDRTGVVTVAGTISGTGTVVQNSNGVLALTADNSYSGGTELNSGAILIGADGALGTGTLAMAEGTAIGFSGSQTISNAITVSGDPYIDVITGQAATISGVISDGTAPGDIVKTGQGTLILTAANTYTGGTVIEAGTLALVGSGAIVGRLVDNGTFDISAADAGTSLTSLGGSGAVVLGARTLSLSAAHDTFAGVISGTGGLLLTGGAQTLTGENSFTGGIALGAGAALMVGDGGTRGSIASDVVANGTLTFNRSDVTSYAGAISGAGLLRQVGAGRLTLSGDSSAYTGLTEVAAGTLAVDGTLGGTLAVARGATLAGAGTVGTTTVAAGGALSPGNGAIGTLTVKGGLRLEAGATYAVDVDAQGRSDLVRVTQAAAIDGGAGVAVRATGGWSLSTRYTVLTAAGGVAGAFNPTIASDFTFLTPMLSYDTNNVYLTLERNAVAFASVAATGNQRTAATGLDTLTGGPLHNAVVQLNAGAARSAFDQLSGEAHASSKGVLIDDSRFVRAAGMDRIRAAFGGVSAAGGPVMAYGGPAGGRGFVPASATTERTAVWAQGFGAWGHLGASGGAARVSHNVGGILVGADAPVLGGKWRVGLLSGYSRSTFNVGDRRSSGEADNFHLGLYGGTQWGQLGLRLGAAYSWSDVGMRRNVAFTGYSDRLRGRHNAGTAQAFGELGYRVDLGRVALEPFAGLAYVNVHTDSFTEQGGAAALRSGSDDMGVTFATLGLRGATSFALGGLDLTATGMLGWRHAWGDVRPTATMAFAGGDPFTVTGAPIGRDAAIVETGISTAIGRGLTVAVSYTGQIGDQAQAHGVRGNLSWRF
nr:autotransporter domain-containing protein [uncultured Roseococcus sp.]